MCPDPSGNLYLVFAAPLEAGLDGRRKKIKPPPPVEENVYEFGPDRLANLKISSVMSMKRRLLIGNKRNILRLCKPL